MRLLGLRHSGTGLPVPGVGSGQFHQHSNFNSSGDCTLSPKASHEIVGAYALGNWSTGSRGWEWWGVLIPSAL
jgi:hypothetical protein